MNENLSADRPTAPSAGAIAHAPGGLRTGSKIAVFLPNWLGDVVMATPTLRALRQRCGPEAQMVGILRPQLQAVLAGTPWLDADWPFDPHAADPALGRWALVSRMRRERFDLAVLSRDAGLFTPPAADDKGYNLALSGTLYFPMTGGNR